MTPLQLLDVVDRSTGAGELDALGFGVGGGKGEQLCALLGYGRTAVGVR